MVRPNLLRRLVCLVVVTLVVACQGPQPASLAPMAAERVVSRPPIRAAAGMVVSADMRASQVGRDVLRAGGNAIDAAIATGFALAVTHPGAGNIGGGGFMVVRLPDGRATAIDFREKAPLAANADMFLDENGTYSSTLHHNSHLAVGVPGTVAGFAKAHERYGKLPWARLVGPAVDLAAEGFVLTGNLARSLRGVVQRLSRYPATVDAFTRDGEEYLPGEVLRQPDLARTLERIMREGRKGFYRGETARLLAAEMRRGGGLITEEDLARYEAIERTPIRGTFRGYEIISMPPPSSGGPALVQMLNVLEGYDLRSMGHNSAAYIHHVTEAMRRAYRDRALLLADQDFVEVPVDRLTSKEYAAELRQSINPAMAGHSDPADVSVPHESDQTTHYSVVDADGMAVSVTYTLEQGYGSGIVVPGAGFLLNNEMGDFNPQRGLTTSGGLIGTEPNLARPEQRMLSSMTPTILARDGRLVAVIGSPGGRTIINTVLQVALNVMEFDMGIQEAVDARRLHHQWLPDNLRIEAGGVSAETVGQLRAMGHVVQVRGRQGSIHSIMIDPVTGDRLGAPDYRQSDAGAAGH
ncbi:MAG: gamma-glutamyltransferase [Gemmatimonadetes bacterium]|nr:gamma-glutamyltransferase [Gemmatimonadota bacterium]